MKKYSHKTYDTLMDAELSCEDNQQWNVVSIYPTGKNHEVRVVYYVHK